jgi:2-aminoethylphosphonate-pyruvate transaminase
MSLTPLLLNPGPVTLSERVRKALLRPDLCHRESEFADLVLGVREKLSRIYDTAQQYSPVLLTGSGTAAVEAMLQTFCPVDRPVLVLANGVYGERMASMLEAQGKPYKILRGDWLKAIDFIAAAQMLAAEKFAYILSVHHETTTGRLNDLSSLQQLARDHRAPLLLDAVSSFGGEPIVFDAEAMAAVAATANKCLHSVPGISFVLAKKSLLESISHSRSLYLDLITYAKHQQVGFSPFTQAVHSVYALSEALDEFFDSGGIDARSPDYHAKSEYIIEGLRKVGILPLLANTSAYSGILTSFHMPGWTSYETLHEYLKQHGFIIYAGQGRLQGEMFRVAVMGAVGMADLKRCVALIENLKESNA